VTSQVPLSEIARIQDDIEAAVLPDTCIIYSVANTDDGEGGYSESYTAVGTVDCRMDYKSGQEVKVSGAVQAFTGWMLTVPYDTTITAANRVTHGGHTYSIQAVSDTGSWIVCKRAQCQRIS